MSQPKICQKKGKRGLKENIWHIPCVPQEFSVGQWSLLSWQKLLIPTAYPRNRNGSRSKTNSSTQTLAVILGKWKLQWSRVLGVPTRLPGSPGSWFLGPTAGQGAHTGLPWSGALSLSWGRSSAFVPCTRTGGASNFCPQPGSYRVSIETKKTEPILSNSE